MTEIQYGALDLQSATIVTSEIQHENMNQKRMNIQKYSLVEGGRFTRPDFDTKTISIKGHIKGTSKADLEAKIDNMKMLLDRSERNLDIEYGTGTRRYIASCSKMAFGRFHYTIDYIEFDLEFIVSDPPFGTNTDTSTLEYLNKQNTAASTITSEVDVSVDFAGTFRPLPIIQVTFHSVNGLKKLSLNNYSDDDIFSGTNIENYKWQDGDILEVDTKNGWLRVNGIDIDFTFGFPTFSLSNNDFSVVAIGKSYNIDVKFIYYPLWI